MSHYIIKGYAFLLFQDEISVHQLVEVCVKEDDKLFTTISSPTIKDKSVQIRPWNISDRNRLLYHIIYIKYDSICQRGRPQSGLHVGPLRGPN